MVRIGLVDTDCIQERLENIRNSKQKNKGRLHGGPKAAGRKESESQQQTGVRGPGIRREERGGDTIKMQREYEYENHQDGEDANDLQATALSRDVIHAKGSAGERVGAGRVSSNRLD